MSDVNERESVVLNSESEELSIGEPNDLGDKGWLYVLINPSMPDLVKIGKTTRTPEERAAEISKGTGVPTPFVVAYKSFVNDCSKGEAFIHTYFEKNGHRINSNREFFDISITDAINAILKYKENEPECTVDYDYKATSIEEYNNSLVEKKISYEMTMGQNYCQGENGYLQDIDRALDHFKKAKELGCIFAYWWLGFVHEHYKKDYQSSMKYYREGLEKGDIYLYHDLCRNYLLYEKTRNLHNVEICFSKYMDFYEAGSIPVEESTHVQNILEILRGMIELNLRIPGAMISRMKSYESHLVDMVYKDSISNEDSSIDIARKKVLNIYVHVMFEKQYDIGDRFVAINFINDVYNAEEYLRNGYNVEAWLKKVETVLRENNGLC